MADDMKSGARHSAKDRQLIRSIRQSARDIDKAALDLGDDTPDEQPEQEAQQPGKADVALDVTTTRIWHIVKAAGEWELDVLGIPYGSAESKDADGEWFDAKTALHEDKWSLPPAVYYHGYGPDKKPMGEPEYIGRTVKRWVDAAGVWFRVVLDKGSDLARRVWDAAKQGVARASSGSIAHLTRVDPDGHIREWPVVELSVFDATDGKEPANRYAVAVPTAKAIYDRAGLALPEAEAIGGSSAADAARTDSTTTEKSEGITMDAIEMQKAVAEAVAAALKAQKEADEAKAKEAEIAAIKAENEALKAKQAEANRLPGGAPHVRKYSVKYDNLTPAEHALVVDVLRTKMAKHAPSDELVKTLALKVESEAGKDANAALAVKALKGAGLKSDEVMYSTLASHGDEWVGVQYSNQIWEQIRAGTWVAQRMAPYTDVIPDGYESDIVPLESTDPTWYAVSQATDHTSSRPDVTVNDSQLTTAQKNITLFKMGCRVDFSGELAEDSLVRVAPQIIRQMQVSGAEQVEHMLIDGDTETSSSTNINSIGGAMSTSAVYSLLNGFRKYALVTTSNYRSAGALSDEDFLETAKLLGAAGIGADINKVTFISDLNTYWKALQLATVKTRDVFQSATLEGGVLNRVYGFEYKPSAFMHYLSTARKANSAGKVDQTVTTNNLYGAILAVRWDQWRMKQKRRMTIETDRWIESDTNMIVAMARWGLGYRDTTYAAAISYGVAL